jgi:hypothetical protein
VELITDGKVSVAVDPLMLTLVGVDDEPLALTEKALAGEVLTRKTSLKVKTRVVPFELRTPDSRVGSTESEMAPRSVG